MTDGDARSGRTLVVLVCAAQVLAQMGAYTWPALLPEFVERWTLTNRDAGWITGVFYAAYTVAVPLLVTLTDRVDPRTVYLTGVGLTVLSHAAFAAVADGFWSALVIRALAGVGWAGTYMTGLKLLADRVTPAAMSRAVAGHAASIGIAGALSFGFAGSTAAWLGWRGAFVAAALCALGAWLLVLAAASRGRVLPAPGAPLFDFRPVFRNRSAMAYAAAYCVHTLEMSALRGWAVAFLTYSAIRTDTTAWIAPAWVATAMGLIGTWASVAGNEAAIRLGRQRLVRLAMLGSMACGAVIGWLGSWSHALAVSMVLAYALLIWLDSSSLTAGAAGSAAPERRGATLAVHSMLGYAGGFVGPLVLGAVLDVAGGQSERGWGLAFLTISVIVLLGRLVFVGLRPADLAGDRTTASADAPVAPRSA